MSLLGGIFGPVAANLLTTMGQPVTLNVPGGRVYDPTTGQTTVVGGGPETGSGVVLEYNTFIRSGLKDEAGTLIQAGDRQLLLSPVKADGTPLTAPKPQFTVTIGGRDYTITAVAPLSPGGEVIYFECNIRGA